MADAIQLAIRRRTQCDRLNACRLMAHHRIHLRTSKLDANRHPQFPCSKSREKRVRPDITFAPEATAQEFTYNVDLFGRYSEHYRDQLFRSEDMLGCFIKSQRAVGQSRTDGLPKAQTAARTNQCEWRVADLHPRGHSGSKTNENRGSHSVI